MGHRIQITVDNELNDIIKSSAKQSGLSVSSYARLTLMRLLRQKNHNLLDLAIADVNTYQTEPLTLAEFNQQIDNL